MLLPHDSIQTARHAARRPRDPDRRAGPGGLRPSRGTGSHRSAGRAPRPRAVQGDDQGPHPIRRPAPGHRPQPRRGELDRGPTPELRLRRRRPPDVRLSAASTASPDRRGRTGPRHEPRLGRGRYRGVRARTGVNNYSLRQPDARLRALDAQASTPGAREEVYCTKVGSVHPGEMYIVGAHMDGIGWGEAANDDGSGTALVMQLARIFSGPDVRTDRSIRFILWNNEETGLNGSRAYVEQRQALQGKEDPPGSGRYPEPTWLGMIQHDMMLFDHGMPR